MSKRLDFFHIKHNSSFDEKKILRPNSHAVNETERKAHVNFIVGKSLQKSIKLALQIL